MNEPHLLYLSRLVHSIFVLKARLLVNDRFVHFLSSTNLRSGSVSRLDGLYKKEYFQKVVGGDEFLMI
jgi:hypothetical protein